MDCKIDKGIPIPKRGGGGRPRKWNFDGMEVGDSMFSEERAIGNASQKYGERGGKKFVVRAVEGGYRVWRTE